MPHDRAIGWLFDGADRQAPAPQPADAGYRDLLQAGAPAQPGAAGGHEVGARAAHGLSGPGGPLPYHETIQAAFGRHELGGIKAHIGGQAGDAARELDAEAYATAGQVAFARPPDVRAASHEAAHVVQQRSGVQLDGATGQPGDRYERNADAVADRVVAGRSAEDLLPAAASSAAHTPPGPGGDSEAQPVQRIAAPGARAQPSRPAATAASAPAATASPTPTPAASKPAPAKPIEIAPEDEQAMHACVDLIVARLKEAWLSDREKAELLALAETWSQRDERRNAEARDGATPYLDRFLLLLKIRTFVTSGVSSAWQDQTLNAFDELWRALDGDGRFAAVVARSRKQAVRGPESGPPENFWKTLGKQEAMGMLGMVKGLVMGAVGLVDAGAGGITAILKSIPGAEHYIADNPKLAQWFAEQYDYMGRQAFGKEWDDKLALGMTAADIGTEGGKLIWNLVMIGAGNRLGALAKGGGGVGATAAQASVWAERALLALSAIGRLGSLQGVRDAAIGMASVIKRLQKDNKLTVGNLITDQAFIEHAVAMIASVYGAISGGGAGPQRWSATYGGAVLELVNAGVAVKALVEAELSTDPPDVKDGKRGAAIAGIVGALYRAIGQIAGMRDARKTESPTKQTASEATPEAQPAAASPETAGPAASPAAHEAGPAAPTPPAATHATPAAAAASPPAAAHEAPAPAAAPPPAATHEAPAPAAAPPPAAAHEAPAPAAAPPPAATHEAPAPAAAPPPAATHEAPAPAAAPPPAAVHEAAAPTAAKHKAPEPAAPAHESADEVTAKKAAAEESSTQAEPASKATGKAGKLSKEQALHLEGASEATAIEVEAANAKVAPTEATHWKDVEGLIGKPLGKDPPPGYTIYERGDRRFLRRIDADDKEWARLTVEVVEVNGVKEERIQLPKPQERLAKPGALAASIGERPELHQAHHLVPDDVVRTHELFKLAREQAGYNLDRASNGTYLPETSEARDAVPASKELPLHRGSHPEYSKLAVELSDRELARLIMIHGDEPIPANKLADAAKRVEDNMRAIITHWISIYGDKLK